MELKSNAPTGPIEQSWEKHKFDLKLINPANKRKYNVIVVGSGTFKNILGYQATIGSLTYRFDDLRRCSLRQRHSLWRRIGGLGGKQCRRTRGR